MFVLQKFSLPKRLWLMQSPMYICPSQRTHSQPYARKAGFALWIIILGMTALGCLLLGIAEWVRIELKIAAQDNAIRNAREHASLGLEAAKAVVRNYLGGDTRVTAPANIDLSCASQKVNWLGVWDTAQDGTPWQTWLVSLADEKGKAAAPHRNAIKESQLPFLLSWPLEGNKPPVQVPKVPLRNPKTQAIMGHYAFWVEAVNPWDTEAQEVTTQALGLLVNTKQGDLRKNLLPFLMRSNNMDTHLLTEDKKADDDLKRLKNFWQLEGQAAGEPTTGALQPVASAGSNQCALGPVIHRFLWAIGASKSPAGNPFIRLHYYFYVELHNPYNVPLESQKYTVVLRVYTAGSTCFYFEYSGQRLRTAGGSTNPFTQKFSFKGDLQTSFKAGESKVFALADSMPLTKGFSDHAKLEEVIKTDQTKKSIYCDNSHKLDANCKQGELTWGLAITKPNLSVELVSKNNAFFQSAFQSTFMGKNPSHNIVLSDTSWPALAIEWDPASHFKGEYLSQWNPRGWIDQKNEQIKKGTHFPQAEEIKWYEFKGHDIVSDWLKRKPSRNLPLFSISFPNKPPLSLANFQHVPHLDFQAPAYGIGTAPLAEKSTGEPPLANAAIIKLNQRFWDSFYLYDAQATAHQEVYQPSESPTSPPYLKKSFNVNNPSWKVWHAFLKNCFKKYPPQRFQRNTAFGAPYLDLDLVCLAKKIAHKIQGRGKPFCGTADFVNSGLLQAALDSLYPEPKTGIENDRLSPNRVSQADILQSIGPFLTTRDDTLRVHIYGDSIHPHTHKRETYVYGEAILQRTYSNALSTPQWQLSPIRWLP